MTTLYKVMVVDDSLFMRKIISDLISASGQFEVISTASNGKEAVEKVKTLKPDIITMDIEMPEMNGLDALKIIMKENPTPIVILSSLTEEGTNETIKALEWGAVDFIRKPSGSISLDLYKVQSLLLEKLKVAAVTNVRRTTVFPSPALTTRPLKPKSDSKFSQLVAIGTSTGGPKALQQVLCKIPGDFPCPILIVQHMPPNFTKSLAQRLDSSSAIRVVEAENDCSLEAGTAYIAPGGWHMTIYRDLHRSYRIKLSKEPPRNGHRPAVDVLFESMLPVKELKRHIVLMTGMGSDGAKGMQALKQDGAETTIAESQETCVVYGMPRAAVELNCVMYLLPVHKIAEKLIQSVNL